MLICVQISQETITLQAKCPEPITLTVYDTAYTITDKPLTIPLQNNMQSAPRPSAN